ncbi:MAG: hypothetical protein WCT24_00995 [Patescibacteria group bacterium]
MVAEVVIVKRLPRRFSFFDYKIPAGMTVNVGDLVQIDFRHQAMFGVVRAKKNASHHKLIPLHSVVIPGWMTDRDIARFEQIARVIAQSPSAMLDALMTGFRNRLPKELPNVCKAPEAFTVPKALVAELTKIAVASDDAFVETSLEGELVLARLLRKHVNGQMLLLVPRERIAEQLATMFSPSARVAILTGATPAPLREAIIRGWRFGTIQTLIGMRQASLLSPHNLKLVHVLDVASREYGMLDRNPRFDVRLAAQLLAHTERARFISSGSFPVLSQAMGTWHLLDTPSPTIVSMKHQEEKTKIPFLSETLKNAIEESLRDKKNVLLSFNRKGEASYASCGSCGAIPHCPTCESIPTSSGTAMHCPVCLLHLPMPTRCPFCGSDLILEKGLGNKAIKRKLQHVFPTASIGIIDKGVQEPGCDITIATDYYLDMMLPAFKRQFGRIAALNFDSNLAATHFESNEFAAGSLHRLMHLGAFQKAEVLIQTWLPESVAEFVSTKRSADAILKNRSVYRLPPSGTLIRIEMKEPGDLECVKALFPKTELREHEQTVELRFGAIPDTSVWLALEKLPDHCIIKTVISSYDPQDSHQSK